MESMSQRGFSLIEVILACLVIVMGFLAFLSSYSTSLRHSVQSRDHQMALILAENLLEEVQDHFYGQPRPARWQNGTWSPLIITASDPVKTDLHYDVETDPEDGNGSFFEASLENRYDVLRITVKWQEGTDSSSASVQKEVVIKRTVWREKDVFRQGE
jgi:Tfp pilus assembly protein PilX